MRDVNTAERGHKARTNIRDTKTKIRRIRNSRSGDKESCENNHFPMNREHARSKRIMINMEFLRMSTVNYPLQKG
uniref:Uncharacterized protein n=1 Tax=Oryza sativa subsp. indica TaxID=39946 RepID=A0A1B4Z174_ORYSI|nr:hypothetical protein [Oryza sativa Indica Group]